MDGWMDAQIKKKRWVEWISGRWGKYILDG